MKRNSMALLCGVCLMFTLTACTGNGTDSGTAKQQSADNQHTSASQSWTDSRYTAYGSGKVAEDHARMKNQNRAAQAKRDASNALGDTRNAIGDLGNGMRKAAGDLGNGMRNAADDVNNGVRNAAMGSTR